MCMKKCHITRIKGIVLNDFHFLLNNRPQLEKEKGCYINLKKSIKVLANRDWHGKDKSAKWSMTGFDLSF